MMPITRRKTLAIPHGLAAVAAGGCLLLAALGDLSHRQDTSMAEQPGNERAALVAADKEPGRLEGSGEPLADNLTNRQRQDGRSDSRQRSQSLKGWLPFLRGFLPVSGL